MQAMAKAPATAMIYPEDDGLRLANNTVQGRWMVVLYDNLTDWFHGRDDVFVAIDLLWYPIEGRVDICYAPDVFVVFGRHKGDRGSYKQWEENDVPATVVFEILSPANTVREMMDKFAFYEDHGVEEYYIYDPESNRLQIYLRRGEILYRVRNVQDFVSPRLGIRFELSADRMVVFRPDGRPFLSFEEVICLQRDRELRRRDWAHLHGVRLVDLARRARRGQASPEELQELERLEESLPR